MFHVRDDYSADGPITQVGVGWFNKVGKFLNNLIGSGDIIIEKYDGDTPSIIKLRDTLNTMGDEPVENNTNLPTNMATPASQYAPVFTNWDAGGENGVKMRLYTCTGVSGRHYWYPVDIEITNGGTIKSIRMVETAGERQAFQAG